MTRLIIVSFLLLGFGSCSKESDDPSGPDNPPDGNSIIIAIYDDRGAWSEGVSAVESLLRGWGYTTQRIGAEAVRDGILESDFDVFVVPGGQADFYKLELEGTGSEKIRRFVTTGGGFVGICAGAFFAADRIIWFGADIDYPLDLISGYAIGPLPELARPGSPGLTPVRFDQAHPIPALAGIDGSMEAYYYDGPRLEMPTGSVFAWYDLIDAAAATTGTYGQGRIALVGFHPEMNEATHPLLNAMIQWVSSAPQSGWTPSRLERVKGIQDPNRVLIQGKIPN